MGISAMIILFSPYFIVPLLGISFAAVYLGKRICHINRTDIVNLNGSLIPTTFALWGISVGALDISLILLLLVSSNIPFFNGVHGEWGIPFENAYGPAVVYIACWMALFALLQLPSILVLKKKVLRKPGTIFALQLLSSTVITTATLCAVYLTGLL